MRVRGEVEAEGSDERLGLRVGESDGVLSQDEWSVSTTICFQVYIITNSI